MRHRQAMKRKPKPQTCDWCHRTLAELPKSNRYQQFYYANNRQQGRLCFDCHVKEMIHSDDKE